MTLTVTHITGLYSEMLPLSVDAELVEPDSPYRVIRLLYSLWALHDYCTFTVYSMTAHVTVADVCRIRIVFVLLSFYSLLFHV